MTIEIKNAAPCSNVRAVSFIAEPEMDLLVLRLKNANGETTTSRDMPVPALLGALRATLGVLIIDKADLPEVTGKDGFSPAYVTTGRANVRQSSFTFDAPGAPASSAEWHRQNAYAHLALAAYLDAPPPVDEVQVGALADLLRTALGVTPETVAAGTLQLGSSDDIARRLIATGRVEVKA